MMIAQEVQAYGPPHWSPMAIAVGLVIGILIGACVTALYALHLARRNQVRTALQPDPAGMVRHG